MNGSVTAHPDPHAISMNAIKAVWALVGVVLALVIVVRLMGWTALELPASDPVASQTLSFSGIDPGTTSLEVPIGVRVQGGDSVVLAAGEHTFIRGILRATSRQRMLAGVPQEAPYRLVYWDDGRLALEDLATGEIVDLTGFGASNVASFAQLLQPGTLR